MQKAIFAGLILLSFSAFGRSALPKQLLCSFADNVKLSVTIKGDEASSNPKSATGVLMENGRPVRTYPELAIVRTSKTDVDINQMNLGRTQTLVSILFSRVNERGEIYADLWPRISSGWCRIIK